LEGFYGLTKVAILAMAFDQFGFVVEQIDVACGPSHEQLHDSLCFGRMMQ
jgi:hypothetical protein